MFRFEQPEYLYGLILIPILCLLFVFAQYRAKQRLKTYGEAHLLQGLIVGSSVRRLGLKYGLQLLGLSAIFIMLARPQFGAYVDTDSRKGIEVMVALDISNSMLAEDINPNRLVRAKMLVSNLMEKMTNDKIGLVVFAGEAFIQIPITGDYASAQMFLDNITTDLLSAQGTNVASALETSALAFSKNKDVGKAVIVITDGEDHEKGAVQAAEKLKKEGLRTYVLGIGSTKGAPIPVNAREYLKDNEGNTVLTALNVDMCKQIATAGGGDFIQVDNTTRAQDELIAALSDLKRAESKVVVKTNNAEQFQIFALIALVLLVLDICVLERKNPRFKNINLFKK